MDTPSTGAPASDTPAAPSAPSAPESFSDFFHAEQAKADRPADTSPASTDTPAPASPDAPPAPPADPTPAPAEKQGSRREAGRELRAQIEREVREQFAAEQAAARAQAEREAASSVAQTAFGTLKQQARAGDYDAARQLADITDGLATINERGEVVPTNVPAKLHERYQAGRVELVEELKRDVGAAIATLDLLDEDGRAAVALSPTISDALRTAAVQARKPLEAQIATLQAEVSSLRGRLAGHAPSPEAGGGGYVPPSSAPINSIADAFAWAKSRHAA